MRTPCNTTAAGVINNGSAWPFLSLKGEESRKQKGVHNQTQRSQTSLETRAAVAM
jgi:hypothetical protein